MAINPLGAIGGILGLNAVGAYAQSQRMNNLRKQLMDLFSSGALGRETNNIFDMFKSSPIYTGLRQQGMLGATQVANNMQTGFARSGLSRSGIANVALPIARSSFQSSFNNIDMNLFAQALAEARKNLMGRAGVLQDTSGPGFGGLFASGALESLMPLLSKYIKT